jgi:PKD repeat protein
VFALLLVSAAPVRASTSTEQNPVHTFSTSGLHDVTLQVCKGGQCDTITKQVLVLDPHPAVTSAVVQVTTVEVGQFIPLSGSGTGKPPLTYTWRLFQGATLLREVSGATAWLPTAGLAPGLYTVVLRITNASGTADSGPTLVAVVAPRALDFYTVTPCRVLDTRPSFPLFAGVPRVYYIAGICGIPAGAWAIAANVTVLSATDRGNLSFYPGNYPPVGTSAINFRAGSTLANSGVFPLSTDGTTSLGVFPTVVDGGTVHLLIDVSGYFKE